MKRAWPVCGILSSLLYVAMNLFIPLLFDGYSSASQTVSELSAIGTPTRTIWVSLGFAYTLLMIAFGWGVRQSAVQNRHLRVAGNLMVIYGVVSLLWPFFPMHQREVLAGGGKTLTDTMHLALAVVTVLLMTMSMGFGAAALGRQFRVYSIATIMVLFVFGALTGSEASRVEANLPTPWVGIWERINIGAFLLWVVVLSIFLLKVEKPDQKAKSGPLGLSSNY